MAKNKVAPFSGHGVCICAGVSLLHVQFYLRFLYTRFPHLRYLHADSITRAIRMMYFTRCFHYLRNPYPQNDHYPQFHYTRIKSPRYGCGATSDYRLKIGDFAPTGAG